MKLTSKKIGLSLRLGAMAAALLVGQQAMAIGTEAGTVIENTATVDYFVGGIDQNDISSLPVTFVVDRRVNFTLTPASTPNLTTVNPGQNDAFVDFLLTNLSNSDLDFDLVLAQFVANELVDGTANDSADVANPEFAVSSQTVAGGDADPVQAGPQFVDNLPADAQIRIRVWGDAALTMTNGQVAGLQLTATAEDTAGTALAYGGPNTDGGIENVDVNGTNGVQVSDDGFLVQSAQLTVVKDYSVIAGDLGSGLAIPGATVEYTVTVTNASITTAATNVSIADALDTDVAFLAGQYAGNDIQINNAGAISQCSADAAVADSDGCSLDGVNLVVGNANGPITVAADSTLIVSYQVTIPDPDPTP